MKTASHGNFQVGMVDDPSIEDKGGFEFASGMDIFSEPGVIKACSTMEEVSYGASATPTAVPLWMVDTTHTDGTVRLYVAAGTKILEASAQGTFNLFLTNANGANIGLDVWNGYVMYAAQTIIGRAPVNDAASKNDSYIATLDSDVDFHPMIQQGGTLKIGAGRYIASLDESFNFTARAMKLSTDSRIRCLAEYLTNLYMGRRIGAGSGGVLTHDSSVYAWRGTVLSSGSALPDVPYPMKMRGMNAFLVDGRTLYAFPDQKSDILIFDGAGFPIYRKIFTHSIGQVYPGATTQHLDQTLLFAGSGTTAPGVYQMKNGVLCQAFVPVDHTPGSDALFTIGFVKSAFNGVFYMGYYKDSDTSYHIAKIGSNKQNNAVIRTLWHKEGTDKLKRWYGVKLNLKPMAASTVVTVAYRTGRGDAFTTLSQTVTPSTQDKPVIFPANPRSREIQFKFTYTIATTNTPELLSYDPMFEVLNTVR